MLMCLANAFIFPEIVIFAFASRGIQVEHVPILMSCIGNTFIYSLCFYILFMQSFEADLTKLPFLKEYKSMSLLTRNILVSFFNAFGILLITLSPFFCSNLNQLPVKVILVKYLIPGGLLSSLVSVFNTGLQMKGTVSRVKQISDFTNAIAEKDYMGLTSWKKSPNGKILETDVVIAKNYFKGYYYKKK